PRSWAATTRWPSGSGSTPRSASRSSSSPACRTWRRRSGAASSSSPGSPPSPWRYERAVLAPPPRAAHPRLGGGDPRGLAGGRGRADLAPVLVPEPAAVWEKLITTSTEGYAGHTLGEHLLASLRRILLGCLYGIGG